jgi:hypothetical protein
LDELVLVEFVFVALVFVVDACLACVADCVEDVDEVARPAKATALETRTTPIAVVIRFNICTSH